MGCQTIDTFSPMVKQKKIKAPSRVERLACMDHVTSSSKVSHVNSSSNVFTLDPTSYKFRLPSGGSSPAVDSKVVCCCIPCSGSASLRYAATSSPCSSSSLPPSLPTTDEALEMSFCRLPTCSAFNFVLITEIVTAAVVKPLPCRITVSRRCMVCVHPPSQLPENGIGHQNNINTLLQFEPVTLRLGMAGTPSISTLVLPILNLWGRSL